MAPTARYSSAGFDPSVFEIVRRLLAHPGKMRMQRLIGSIRRECIDHIVVFGERHLRHVLLSYMSYYHGPFVIEQGSAEITRCRDSRTHSQSTDPGRTAPSICCDLICDKD